jgi:hypothetical protein
VLARPVLHERLRQALPWVERIPSPSITGKMHG